MSPPPALIREEDYAGDDWLEDDLGNQPRSKRRRTEVQGYLYGNTVWKDKDRSDRKSSEKKSSLSSPKRKKSSTSKQTVMEVEEDREEMEEELFQNNENMSPKISQNTSHISPNSSRNTSPMSSPHISQTDRVGLHFDTDRLFESSDEDIMEIENDPLTQRHQNQTSTQTKRNKLRSKQLKLTDFTTQNNVSERGLNDQIMDSIPSSLTVRTTNLPRTNSFQSGPNAGGVRRIRVKIQDKTIMVPVQPDTK